MSTPGADRPSCSANQGAGYHDGMPRHAPRRHRNSWPQDTTRSNEPQAGALPITVKNSDRASTPKPRENGTCHLKYCSEQSF